MINFTAVTCHQTSTENGDGPWIMKDGDRVLLQLPAETNVQDTFKIRDAIGELCKEAFEQGKEQADGLCQVKIERIVENGNHQLDLLKEENLRLSSILEQQIGEESL